MDISNCRLCPRQCGVDRTLLYGYCGGGSKIKVARASFILGGALYKRRKWLWDSFLFGMHIKMLFCQNYKISAENFGKEISEERLAEIF